MEPATGEILYDLFDDSVTRDQLEMRLTHVKPVEILLPETISKDTENLISELVFQR